MIGAVAVKPRSRDEQHPAGGSSGRGSAKVSGVWCSSDKGSTWSRVLAHRTHEWDWRSGHGRRFCKRWHGLGRAWLPARYHGEWHHRSNAPVTSCTINFTQQTLPATFTAGNIGRITLALAPSNNATIYAAIADATTSSATLVGVVRSINATAAVPTWTQLTDPLVSAATGFCTGACFYDMALAVDTTNPAVVYAGGMGGTQSSAPPRALQRHLSGLMLLVEPLPVAQFPTLTRMLSHLQATAARCGWENDGGVWSTSNTGR